MLRKIVEYFMLGFILVFIFCLNLYAGEYLILMIDDPGKMELVSPSVIENDLNRGLEESGIRVFRKRKFYSRVGLLHVSITEEDAIKLSSCEGFLVIPAERKLYPSIVTRESDNELDLSQIPWHVEISLPLSEFAHDAGADFSDVRVFVLDTGVQREHPQLINNLDMVFARHFFEVYSGDELISVESDEDVSDSAGHGTFVTGVVGGSSTGVSPETLIVPLKASNQEGTMTLLALAAAVDYILDLKEGVMASKGLIVNLSFNSGPGEDKTLEAFFDNILLSLARSDVLFISSAGNGTLGVGTDVDSTPVYPTYNESVNFLSVASVNETGFLDFFSNYGERTVEIAAPGSNIVTTNKDLTTSVVSGTSFASPFAAGIASIIWSLDPSLEYWQVRNLLIHAVRGKDLDKNFIDEYAGTSPEFLFLLPSALSQSDYGTLDLSVISGKALYPSIIANEDNPSQPSEPVLEIPGGGGCNAFSGTGLVLILFPFLICLLWRKSGI